MIARCFFAAALAALAACTDKPPQVPDPEAVVDVSPTLDEPPQEDLSHSSGVIVVSSPPTRIKVDGKDVGMSPVTVEDLSAGEHEVTFEDAGGDVTMTVDLGEGEYQKVHHNVTPKATDAKMPEPSGDKK